MKFPKITLIMSTERQTEREFLLGIARYAAEFGPWEFVHKPLDYLVGAASGTPDNAIDDCDGFIVRGRENLDKVSRFGRPTVFSGIRRESSPDAVNIVTDSEAIGKMAANYLLGLGLSNFAYCGFDNIEWSEGRRLSFARALSDKGIVPNEFQVCSAQDKDSFVRWLQELPHPTALFACNDDCAMLTAETAKLSGIRVPEDLVILGVDNDELVCSLSNPPLSSIDLSFERCGYEAARTLAGMLRAGKQLNDQITVSPIEVVERQSTNIVMLHEETVSQALSYIQLKYQEPIQVQDVADNIGVSRRVLEKKFKKHLNRSILSEINRLRFDHIARLLLETNMTVTEIAANVRFSSPEHISRQFRNEKGLSPSEYRKQNSRNVI